MACPDETPVVRMAEGVAAYLEHCVLPEYRGEVVYPCGPGIYWRGAAVEWHYSSSMTWNDDLLQRKIAEASGRANAALQALREALKEYPRVGGYTHSIPHYGRILREGLDSYAARIEVGRRTAEARGERGRLDFYRAMARVLEGIQSFCERVVQHVKATRFQDECRRLRRKRLLQALRRVPRKPARNCYEALVAMNFIWYLDGSDNYGRFDQELFPYYEADLTAGQVVPEEVTDWIRQLWDNVDACSAWNVALGGLLADGASGINEVTHLCLQAAHGKRRPNLALRLHQGASERIWDDALDCIETGNGLPALYNEEAYIAAIRGAHLGVRESDLPWFAFGGCTELMVHGRSNVGSLEGDINLPLILVETQERALASSRTFDDFKAAYKDDVRRWVRRLTETWNANQERKARWQPQVMRSLLIDDCLENGREYNAGGARYNWCVVNVMGLANVIDSLAAIREVVFEHQELSGERLASVLAADFEGHEPLRQRLARCPRFGNAEPVTDALAEEISEFVFRELLQYAPWRGGKYLPSCLMFTTYAHFGEPVRATADGRRAGEPIADSAGAVQGRDVSGPTALLSSVAKIKHHLAPGTLVVNARFSKKFFTDRDTRRKLKELVQTYFELGGMQLQINVVDQALLRDAYEHPERHKNLIIRVGGYSEYWIRLDDALRRTILERTEHEG